MVVRREGQGFKGSNQFPCFTFHFTYSNIEVPDGFSWQSDEAGDGVGQGQVEHDVVNISPRSELR